MKVFNIDNRKILGAVFVLVFVGAGLIGDWQAIGHKNPCSNYMTGAMKYGNASGIVVIEENITITSNASLHQEWCEGLSNSSDECSWNPQSHITGEFCNTCRKSCLSKHYTINFYQFTFGILVLAFVTPLAFIVVSAIASDIAPVSSQVHTIYIMIDCLILSSTISAFCLLLYREEQ